MSGDNNLCCLSDLLPHTEVRVRQTALTPLDEQTQLEPLGLGLLLKHDRHLRSVLFTDLCTCSNVHTNEQAG